MKRGNRIYYNQNGKIIFQTYEIEGDVTPHLENEIISYIDLKYGDTSLDNVQNWHIEDGKIIIDKYRDAQETEQEKLLREKQELENQLIISENKNIGGIL